jgi:hypothetical protein
MTIYRPQKRGSFCFKPALVFAISDIVCRHFLQAAFELQKPNIGKQHYYLSKIYLVSVRKRSKKKREAQDF